MALDDPDDDILMVGKPGKPLKPRKFPWRLWFYAILMTEAGQLTVGARHGMLISSLRSEVMFPSGSAELSKQGEVNVHEVGFTLKGLKGDRRFMIIGHTDTQPIARIKPGPNAVVCVFHDNWELSTARALT